jgi:hypothetical protein
VGILLLTHIFQILCQKELYFVNRCSLGWDFKYVWDAAVRMSQGISPYASDEYCWPTFLPWVLWKSGMMGWGLATLAKGMVLLSLGCILLACYLASRLFSDVDEDHSDNIAPLLLIVFSSFPVYFLLDRGNLDGLTMAFMWGGLWLGFRGRSSNWQAVAGGLLLAVGVGIKVYPIVLLAPLFIFGRIRIMIGMVVGIALMVAIDHDGWRILVTERLSTRVAGEGWSGIYALIENASLEAFFLIVIQLLRDAGAQVSDLAPQLLARITAGLALATAFVSTFLLRHDRNRRVQLAWIYSFIPISFGALHFSGSYALINVIPLAICSRFLMAQYRATRHARTALLVVFVGIGLGQLQASALAKIFSPWVRQTGNVPDHDFGSTYNILSASCSIGLFVTILSLAAFQVIVAWPSIKGWTRRAR